MPKVWMSVFVSTAFASQCAYEESWMGVKWVVVPGCKGVGCHAGGQDQDCAWCVTDMHKCDLSRRLLPWASVPGNFCKETQAARDAQNVSCVPMPPTHNIADWLATWSPDDWGLSTLSAAVLAGDLVEMLSSPGPFTLFAPNNHAFAALPAGVLDSLMQPENKAQLIDILTYHVVSGSVYVVDLKDGQKIATVEGKSITVTSSFVEHTSSIDDVAMINNATILEPGLMLTNGVVHVIDGLLSVHSQVLV